MGILGLLISTGYRRSSPEWMRVFDVLWVQANWASEIVAVPSLIRPPMAFLIVVESADV
ncbi:MAG: hypothetical protein ACI8T1_003081 [Verrucomicrobiales bacterium]|jgi:hypothetical protein